MVTFLCNQCLSGDGGLDDNTPTTASGVGSAVKRTFHGHMDAKANNLPAFLLTLTNSNGTVVGQRMFFLQTERGTRGGTMRGVQQVVDAIIADDTFSFRFAPSNTQAGDSKSPETFKFVQMSPTQARLTPDRAGEHFEIVLTKVNWVERHF